MGRSFSAGQITSRSTWGKDNVWQEIQTVYSLGPVAVFEGLYVDQTLTGIDGDGVVAIANRGRMRAYVNYGRLPEASPFGAPASPIYSSSFKLSGLAASSIQLQFDAKGGTTFTTEPQCGYVMKGVTAYDPRKDSTYPGGSGPQRVGDETTWTWSDNPALHALTWLIGRRQNGKLVMGVGMALAGILLPQYVEAANIADANGWKIGGVVSSGDDKWNALKQMLQAGGAEPLRLGAQLGCIVNTPRVSLATLGVGDVVGDASVQATQAIRDRINAIVPRCRFEDQQWEVDAASPVVVDDYVAFDGVQRRKEVEYSLVQCFAGQQPTQAVQLARYDIENSREFGPIVLPCKLRWMGYRPGDVVTVNLPELGLNNQDVLITSRSLSPQDGIVTITARSETAGKHPYALGQTGTPPPTPSVSGPALVSTPAASAWTLTGGQIVADNGTTKPVLQVVGSADSDAIDAIFFEYREATGALGVGDGWIGYSTQPPSCQAITITGCKDQTAYQVAVSYRRRGNAGARLILGPAVAGQTSVPWQTGVTGDGKPENGATNGAPSGSPFGDTTVDDVLSMLHDVEADIDQLQQDVANGTSPDLTQLKQDVSDAQGQIQSILTDTGSIHSTLNDVQSSVTSEAGARSSADTALSGRVDGVVTSIGNVDSRVTTEVGARSNADSALGYRIDTLNTSLGTASARISDEASARASADSTITSKVNSLTSRMSNAEASISTNSTAIANNQSAIANLSTTVQAISPTVANLVVNTSMKSSSGWGTQSPWYIDTTYNQAKLNGNISNQTVTVLGTIVPASQGQIYSIGMDAWTPGLAGGTLNMDVAWYDGGKNVIGYSSRLQISGRGDGNVRRYGKNGDSGLTGPVNTAYMQPRIFLENATTDGGIAVQRLQIERGGTSHPWVDYTDPSGLSAQVQQNTAAISDITNNKLAAYWQVKATAGNQSASIAAVAQSGSTTYSAVEIIAQQFTIKTSGATRPILAVVGDYVAINGNLVVTDSLVDNAATNIITVVAGSAFNGDGGGGSYSSPGNGRNGGQLV